MPNMSHCRFENTYSDLMECLEALQNEGGVEGVESEANQYEAPFVRKLVELCGEIWEEFNQEEQ